MSTTREKETYTSINYFAVKNHLREWQEGLMQLEKDVAHVKKEAQAKYYEQLGILRLQLQDLQTKLESLSGEMPKAPDYDPVQFRKDMFVFRSVFYETAHRIRDEENVGLDWLQGFVTVLTYLLLYNSIYCYGKAIDKDWRSISHAWRDAANPEKMGRDGRVTARTSIQNRDSVL